MALNQSVLVDEDQAYSDWIEIHNAGDTAVGLQGWALTDDKELPLKWLFPDITINAGEYLVVFASGKDHAVEENELHTNFKLNGSGEYLALNNPSGNAVTMFDPGFPAQKSDYSFGWYDSSYIEYSDPTPGEDNSHSTGAVTPVPTFNVEHGFFESPFQLRISSSLAEAKIYYTNDGSTPDENNGTLYTSEIEISTSTVIRAIAIADGELPSETTTRTYLFIDDVIHQTNTPEGYPAEWGPYARISGNAIADYEMDPEMMADTNFAKSCKEALLDIPTVSLVSDIGNFFSHSQDPDEGGIYIYTGAPVDGTIGRGWERPVSFEFFDPNSSESVQINCAMKLHGGHGRLPEKSPKHSFLIGFKSEYGPSRLDHPFFGEEGPGDNNKLVIRAGFCNSWIHHSHDQRTIGLHMRDIWTKDTQRDMGHSSSKSIYAHLYLNGIYWGLYKPMERMDKDYGAKHLGGEPEDWDVIKDQTEVADGNDIAWKKLLQMADAGVKDNDDYQRIIGNNPDGTPNPEIESMVDVVNLADYMLLNFFGANSDWDHHNWAAMRNRVNPGKGFKFLCWDAEHMVKGLNDNNMYLNNDGCPSRIFKKLMENDEFKRLFADRVQINCFNGGALTPGANVARWMIRKNTIEKAVLAESARWGDYRRDVHRYQTSGPFELYTYEDHWIPQQNYMLNTYFPNRTDWFVNKLRSVEWFPNVDAPVLFINNNPPTELIISEGDELSMTTPQGTIYYTTNGTDPAYGQTSSDSVIQYTAPLGMEHSAHIVARTFYNGEWSAKNDQFFVIPKDYNDLKITEIHYNPLSMDSTDGNNFEFVELKNTGTSTLYMGGLGFTNGIDYKFPPETQLGPQEFMVLASNSLQFYSLYNFAAFDEYKGKLDNNGELLVLQTQSNDTIVALKYDDGDNWPDLADGEGNSLVPMVFNPENDQTDAADWRASYRIGGSPGADDIFDSTDVPNTTYVFDTTYVSDTTYVNDTTCINVTTCVYGSTCVSDTTCVTDKTCFADSTDVTDTTDVIISKYIPSDAFVLAQNYPNPFKNVTYIDYRLPDDAFVELSIYDLIGQRITTLVSEHQEAGLHQVEWNNNSNGSQQLSKGIYVYRLTIKSPYTNTILTKKMILR